MRNIQIFLASATLPNSPARPRGPLRLVRAPAFRAHTHPVSAAPGSAAPLCTADDKCPYKTNNYVAPPGSLLRNVSTTKPIRTPDGQPALAGRKSVLCLALEKYLTDK